jgi:hypothetical protein
MGRWPLSEGDPTTLPKECTLSSIPFGFRKNKGGQSQRNFYKKTPPLSSVYKTGIVLLLSFNQQALTMTITLSYTVGLAAIYAIRKFMILRTLQRI